MTANRDRVILDGKMHVTSVDCFDCLGCDLLGDALLDVF